MRALARAHPQCVWYVPLGLHAWMIATGVDSERCVELDWWEERTQRLPSVDRAAGSPAATLRIVCTPSQHFSGRGLHDRDATLWASWALIGEGGPQAGAEESKAGGGDPEEAAAAGEREPAGAALSVWFGGDTGYRAVPRGFDDFDEEARAALPACPAFSAIGRRLGPFTLACIPIGAYSPRWFMSPIHCDP